MSRFGRRVAFLRERADMTQAELAEAIGTSPEIISRIEHAKSLPSLERILRIADTLAVDVADLFGPDERTSRAGAERMARLAALLRRLSSDDAEVVVGLAELLARKRARK